MSVYRGKHCGKFIECINAAKESGDVSFVLVAGGGGGGGVALRLAAITEEG